MPTKSLLKKVIPLSSLVAHPSSATSHSSRRSGNSKVTDSGSIASAVLDRVVNSQNEKKMVRALSDLLGIVDGNQNTHAALVMKHSISKHMVLIIKQSSSGEAAEIACRIISILCDSAECIGILFFEPDLVKCLISVLRHGSSDARADAAYAIQAFSEKNEKRSLALAAPEVGVVAAISDLLIHEKEECLRLCCLVLRRFAICRNSPVINSPNDAMITGCLHVLQGDDELAKKHILRVLEILANQSQNINKIMEKGLTKILTEQLQVVLQPAYNEGIAEFWERIIYGQQTKRPVLSTIEAMWLTLLMKISQHENTYHSDPVTPGSSVTIGRALLQTKLLEIINPFLQQSNPIQFIFVLIFALLTGKTEQQKTPYCDSDMIGQIVDSLEFLIHGAPQSVTPSHHRILECLTDFQISLTLVLRAIRCLVLADHNKIILINQRTVDMLLEVLRLYSHQTSPVLTSQPAVEEAGTMMGRIDHTTAELVLEILVQLSFVTDVLNAPANMNNVLKSSVLTMIVSSLITEMNGQNEARQNSSHSKGLSEVAIMLHAKILMERLQKRVIYDDGTGDVDVSSSSYTNASVSDVRKEQTSNKLWICLNDKSYYSTSDPMTIKPQNIQLISELESKCKDTELLPILWATPIGEGNAGGDNLHITDPAASCLEACKTASHVVICVTRDFKDSAVCRHVCQTVFSRSKQQLNIGSTNQSDPPAKLLYILCDKSYTMTSDDSIDGWLRLQMKDVPNECIIPCWDSNETESSTSTSLSNIVVETIKAWVSSSVQESLDRQPAPYPFQSYTPDLKRHAVPSPSIAVTSKTPFTPRTLSEPRSQSQSAASATSWNVAYPMVESKWEMAWALLMTPEFLIPVTQAKSSYSSSDGKERVDILQYLGSIGVFDAAHLPFCDLEDFEMMAEALKRVPRKRFQQLLNLRLT